MYSNFFSLQFKDFLLLYNQISETCFRRCADSTINREMTSEEVSEILRFRECRFRYAQCKNLDFHFNRHLGLLRG